MILVRGVMRVEDRAFWYYHIQNFPRTRTGRAAIDGTDGIAGLEIVGGRACFIDEISFR